MLRLKRPPHPASTRGANDALVLQRRVASGLVPPPPSSKVSQNIPQPGVAAHVASPSSADLFAWLFAGGLAHPSGGIAGWRDRRTGRLSDEYPEISGYFLSAAVFADATGAEPVARAAEWLIARIEANELASRRADGSAIYNFDLGIVAAGLIKYGVREGRAPAVTAGIRAASRLRDQVNEYGHLPTLDAAGGLPLGRQATWSTVGRLHLAKVVQCLLLADELGAAGMREAARTIVDDVRIGFSLASDSLREGDGRINLHAACYALEGLWIWDAAQSADKLDDVLRKGFGELVSYRRPSGGFPRNACAEAREQSDVHAQAIRLAALLGRQATVQTSIARLRQVALPSDRGWAMPYQPEASEAHENAWATMFAAQALALVDGSSDLEWWELI